MSIIKQETGFISIIDPTLPVGSQIVLSLSLDCVAIAKYNTDVSSVVQFKDTDGRPIGSVKIDASLQLHDTGGSPTTWAGTIDELINKLNNDYFKAASAGGGTSDTTAANQLTQMDQTIAKKIGYVLDLEADNGGNWAAFPVGFDTCTFTYADKTVTFNGASKSLANTKELADFLNNNQNDLFFAELVADSSLYFIGRNEVAPEIQEIALDETISAGNLLEYTSFADTTDQVTGALHEAVTLLSKLVAGYTIASIDKRRVQVLAGASITFEGYKELEVVCHAPDASFDFVYNGGPVLTLPFTDTEDNERIKGVNDKLNGSVYKKKLVVTNNTVSNYFITYSIVK